MEQRTAEWFEARKGMITGSRAAAALGISPWQTPEQLMREMVREYHGAESERVDNMIMEYGRNHENLAMLDYMSKTGNVPEECGFIVHPDIPWLGASPDGLIGDDTVLEIKAPWKYRNKKDPDMENIFSVNLSHYMVQVQIEMACSVRPLAHFYQWGQWKNPAGGIRTYDRLEYVVFNKGWFEHVLPQLAAFRVRFLKELDNPEHLEPLRIIIRRGEASLLVSEYSTLGAEIDNATARRKEILEELAIMTGGKNAEICGRKFTAVEKAGSISYAKALKKYAPDADLEPFRGKPSSFWKLS